MNSKPNLKVAGDDFDSVNELTISDGEEDFIKPLNGVPASNIKNNLISVNSNIIDQNAKNPFTNNNLKKSKYSV